MADPAWPESGFEDPSLPEATAFVVATYALSFLVYSLVIASDRGWIAIYVPPELAVFAVLVPAAVAAGLRGASDGRSGLRRFLDQSMRWRFARRWWIATLVTPPVLIGASWGAYLLAGGPVYTSSASATLQDTGPMAVLAVPLVVAVTLLLAFGEEAGWRGYLLPRLQTRFSAFGASVILGVIWFGWQLPLVALPGSQNTGFPLWLWGLAIVALAVVYTWLFNVTRGSVLAVTLFQAGLNVWGRLVALHPNETGETMSAFFIAGGQGVLAVILILAFGWKTLSGYGEHGERVTTHSGTGQE